MEIQCLIQCLLDISMKIQINIIQMVFIYYKLFGIIIAKYLLYPIELYHKILISIYISNKYRV